MSSLRLIALLIATVSSQECTETNEDLSSAIQTKVAKEIHASQEWGPFKEAQKGFCLKEFYPQSGSYVPSLAMSFEACQALCKERDDCAGFSMPFRTRLPYGYNGFMDPGNPKKDECYLHKAGYLAPHFDMATIEFKCFEKIPYRNLFTITMPMDKRMISIDGATKNFRDWVADTLLPLAATKAQKFYSCERGDSMTFYMEFVGRDQGNSFLNIFAWKPCTYFQAVKDSESTFAGLDNGGTKWQAELSEHAFDVGISCGDCKLIEPVQPLEPVKICTAEQVQAIIAASGR